MRKTYKGRQIISSLKKKGFKEENRDHVYLTLLIGGKETKIKTKISHSHKSKQLPPWILIEIAKQLGFKDPKTHKVDWQAFYNFIDCPMDYNQYIQYLQQKGII
ncbi:hypothetical protein [Pyrococcus kukulkanii]|uniref:Type II toxin-antitoxin system HicA family toxin n=1 Tax=Pyrococcus kukulkanii TaxID=1609559 RepID=A0A127B8J2_9EURY|nr:hypothetical protein [Pyrococcus kukulkanii]AMM53497.1 hypothetical protein TQ32_02580 [Pyrococcus kukulkanii]